MEGLLVLQSWMLLEGAVVTNSHVSYCIWASYYLDIALHQRSSFRAWATVRGSWLDFFCDTVKLNLEFGLTILFSALVCIWWRFCGGCLIVSESGFCRFWEFWKFIDGWLCGSLAGETRVWVFWGHGSEFWGWWFHLFGEFSRPWVAVRFEVEQWTQK